jgi:dethiobiotin synthetase
MNPNFPRTIFVTGIGTEVGKTFCSAIMVEALKADYWKPIQAGDLHQLDADFVKKVSSNPFIKIHPARHLLKQAMSPHAAAVLDGVSIELTDFELPITKNHIIIEGAGGLMVPLNVQGDLVVDLIQNLKTEVVLVVKNYLGSINHTLLSIELLKQRNIKLLGLIFNGETNEFSESIILSKTGVKCLARIPQLTGDLNEFVVEQAEKIRESL